MLRIDIYGLYYGVRVAPEEVRELFEYVTKRNWYTRDFREIYLAWETNYLYAVFYLEQKFFKERGY